MENIELKNFIEELEKVDLYVYNVVEKDNKYIIVLNHSSLGVDIINKCRMIFKDDQTIGIDFSISPTRLVVNTNININ